MNQPNIILLCSTRLAFPSMHIMLYLKQLRAIVIPENAEEMIENTGMLLKDAGIPIVIVSKKNFSKKITELIRRHEINLGLIVSFAYKLPSSVYNLPSFGFFNIHPGPLPAYRGPDPVFRQILNMEKFCGVSIHKLDNEFDTGPVVMTEMITLNANDTHGIVTENLAMLASKMLATFLRLFSVTTDIPSRAQDESTARYFQRQGVYDTVINWKVMEATRIIALINACNPWNKGAITKLNMKIIRIVEAMIEEGNQADGKAPGTILSIDERGLRICALNEKIICARIIYVDEGFLPAGRLAQFGIRPGMQFTQLSVFT